MRPVAALVVLGVASAATGAQSSRPRTVKLGAPNATLQAEFTRVGGIRELSDGRVLAVDGAEKKLFVADWSTGAATQLGRTGSGPGEYAEPGVLFGLGGDSTLLPDTRNGRWLLLHGTSIVATIGPDAPAIMSGARNPQGADHQGNVIIARGLGTGAAIITGQSRTDSLALMRIARTSGHVDTVAVLRGRPATINVQGPSDKPTAVSITMNPLAAGEVSALFQDGWIAIARLDPYRVDWIAPDGKRTRGSPLPFDRVRLDAREIRAYVDRQAARNGTPARDPASFPAWPEVMPPFLPQPLLPAPDGRLWIRRPSTAANPDPVYDVVDRRGALVARVASGKDVQVIGFGRASVYTIATDDNGIQQLQRRPFPGF